MIFVTVGTTRFDQLIKAVDRAKGKGLIDEEVICQIGSGEYLPQYCEHFKFKPSIDELQREASLVITHGGATTLKLLSDCKPFIAVANTSLSGDHQSKFLASLATLAPIIWSRDPEDLPTLLQRVKTTAFTGLTTPSLASDLCAYVDRRI